jgi:proline dehydrogenase
MIDFKNTQIAFESKSNADLRRAKILFSCMQRGWIVKTGKFLAETAAIVHFPISWALKPTIYRHFVGGESLEESVAVAEKLAKTGVFSIFDYSVEGGGTENIIKDNFDEVMHSIIFAKEHKNVAFAVFKPTSLVAAELLEKASSGNKLTEEEQTVYQKFCTRFEELCKKAYETEVRILVDAENYCYQNEIDRLTEEMMRKYNKKRAIVFATLQMYRCDRMEYLEFLHKDAIKNGYIAGIKFVRGAYMEKERARAKKIGYKDPICPTKEATDKNYDNGLRYTVENIEQFEIFNGTHNENSNLLLTELIKNRGIEPDDKRIFFAQLYGMSDNISYNLSKAGYNVAKYVPYAPVKAVLPYLIRRAEENTSIAGQTSREMELLNMEMRRRREIS